MSTAVEILTVFLTCSSVLIFNVNKGLTSSNFPTCKSRILVVEVFP